MRTGSGILAFALTPFLVTAVYRLVDAVPTSLPFAAALLLAVVLWASRPWLRPIAIGMALASVLYAASLAWLLHHLGTQLFEQ